MFESICPCDSDLEHWISRAYDHCPFFRLVFSMGMIKISRYYIQFDSYVYHLCVDTYIKKNNLRKNMRSSRTIISFLFFSFLNLIEKKEKRSESTCNRILMVETKRGKKRGLERSWMKESHQSMLSHDLK